MNRPVKYNEDGEVEEVEEEELEEGQKKSFEGYVVDEAIMPKSCIVLTGSDRELIKRVKNLPEHVIQGTHYTAEDMERRLAVYRELNNSTVAEPSVSDFFKTQGIELYTTSCMLNPEHTLDAFKIYIERNEKPFNFMTFDEVAENKRNLEFLMREQKFAQAVIEK